MPGVTFTQKSADRIAKVVKKVETTPSAEPVQQRRRAGGYRMESLFEVTAVQTGDETVTLKRVQDTDDNLNDRSETIDVAYDPDNTPAVGDRGLIIRLGDGTRFFFRRETIVRIPITEVARVDDATPGTNTGYWPLPSSVQPIEKTRAWSGVGTHEERLAFKFQKQIPASASLPSQGVIQLYTDGLTQLTPLATSPTTDNLHTGYYMRPIRDDFNPSTLTWNQLAGLTKGGAQVILLGRAIKVEIQLVNLGMQQELLHRLLGGDFPTSGGKANWGEAYGVELYFFTALPLVSWRLDGVLSQQLNSTTSFIEWVI